MITREEEVSWAYLLDPCFQFENTAGKPLTGGYIEVYLHGTRDKYYCASDFNGTLHPFQIKLDSLGANIVLADPSNSYDVYVYNRYGNLVMSRYNVSTGHTGSGAYDRYDELENLIVSAVTGLQGEIDNIDEALDGKKDKQEVVSLTFTNTQTVSSIVQNENGELEITYQEIALPEQVPNIDIVSLASTISVTSVYDPETNIKTFNIDISDIGALEYGQYTAEAFVDTATMVKNKGNIRVENGKLKLRKGNSYHITVRGDYTSSDLDNTVQVIEYVEAISNNRIKVDVDNTVADPQHFELSYDIFKLSRDIDYQVGFNQNTGIIGNLVLEIHSLSNVSVVNGGGGGEQVQADWTEEDPDEPSYIQHKPDIKDLVEGTNIRFREEEDAIYIDAVVTAIPTVTGFATHEEVYNATVTAIDIVTANIPADNVFIAEYGVTTSSEMQAALAEGKEIICKCTLASTFSSMPDIGTVYLQPIKNYDVERFPNESIIFGGVVYDVNYNSATQSYGTYKWLEAHFNANTASWAYVITTNDPLQAQANWNETNSYSKAYIQNKPDLSNYALASAIPDTEEVQFEEINLSDYALASAIPVVTGFATHEEVYNSEVTAIQFVTGLIPEGGVTEDDVYNATVTAIEFVTAIIPEAQVQSDWTEEDNTDPAYILNKPTEKFLLEGDNIRIRETNAGVYIDAIVTAIPVVTGFTTNSDVYNATVTAVQLATSLIPEEQVQSDWNVTAIDSPAYIKNKPEILDTLPLKAGDNISLEVDEGELVIAVTGEMGRTYTAGDYISIDDNDVISVTGVAAATAIPDTEEVQFEEIDLSDYALASAIPEQVQSDWAATGVSDPDYIKNKPDITPLIEGSNIHFTETAEGIMISASMPPASGTVTEVEVYNATVTAVQLATGQIPDVSDFVTEDQVTALLPDTEDVQFEEIDLGDYALASAIPDVTNLASKAEVYNSVVTGVQLATAQIPDVSGFATKAQVYNATVTAIDTVTSIIPEAQVQSDWNVTAIDNPAYIKNKPEILENMPLKAGEGIGISIDDNEVIVAVTGNYLTEIPSTYATDTEVYNSTVTAVQLATAQIPDVSNFATDSEVYNATVTGVQLATAQIPDSEDVTFEEVDLSDYALVTAIPDVSNLTTQTDVYNATVTAVQLATAHIPDVSDMATKTWVGEQGYLTSIPSTYATDTEVYNATVTGIAAATGWVDAQNYLTSVPNTYATKTYVNNSVTGLQTKLTGINDVQVVASLPANPTSNTLYLIPEV